MISRRSSGSSRDERAADPARSQNITLSGRRSAEDEPTVPVRLVDDRSGSSAGVSLRRSPAIASSSWRRWPIDVIPRSLRSPAVSLGKSSASTSFARNVASYCSRPSARSQSATSIATPWPNRIAAQSNRCNDGSVSPGLSRNRHRAINPSLTGRLCTRTSEAFHRGGAPVRLRWVH